MSRLDLDPARLMAEQVRGLAQQMTDAAVDQDARDAAARRLLEIGSNEARSAVQFALRDPGNNPGRIAAARAIADDAPADGDFVDPLFAALDPSSPRPLIDAAAVALGNYKSQPDVAARLVAMTAANRPEVIRLAAIRALSTQIEKRAAARLVELAQDNASPAISAAAVDALQTFASLPYDSPADWATWWRGQADLNDDRFRLDVLTARATRFEQQARRGEETYQELQRSILATLAATPREQRGDALLRYLTSPREVVRLIAIRRAYDYAATADLAPSARPQIRAMLADVSADVRFEAARIVHAVNDADALPIIAQQIAIEPEARVRAMMAEAIGTIGNVAALPLLRPLLDDPSTLVLQSTAAALAKLGDDLARADPDAAADLAGKLTRVLEARGAQGGGRVRASLIAAIVPLRQRSMTRTFIGMLTRDPPEPPEIRRLAAQGLGAIADPGTDSVLVDALVDAASEVRLEAVRALGALGRVNKTFVNAPRLLRLVNDAKVEPDAKVRAEAWTVIRALLPFAPLSQLDAWPDAPQLRADDAKRLEVLLQLANGYGAAGRTDPQIDWLQGVAETQLRLAEAASAAPDGTAAATRWFNDSAATYQNALAIARQSGRSMRAQTLSTALVHSLLRGRNYAGAAAFVRSLSPAEQEIVGPEFKREAEELVQANKVDDARSLIREATALGKNLPENSRNQIDAIRRALEQRQGEHNEFDLPDILRQVCLR